MAKLPWYLKAVGKPKRVNGCFVQNFKVHKVYRIYVFFKKGKYGKATEMRDCILPYLDIDAQMELQGAIEQVLYETYAPGNGGYCSNFGPIALSKLVKLTGFDMNKRRIHEKS